MPHRLLICGPSSVLPHEPFVSQRLFLGRVKFRTLTRQARAIYARNLLLERLLNDMASVWEDVRPDQHIEPLQKSLIYRDSYLCDTHNACMTIGHTPSQARTSILTIMDYSPEAPVLPAPLYQTSDSCFALPGPPRPSPGCRARRIRLRGRR